jgi:exodeoxyribonuclease V beta subunit
MNIWLMPGEAVGSGDYQTFMAQLCAAQIRDWLSAGQQGRALLWRNDNAAGRFRPPISRFWYVTVRKPR